MIKIACAGDNCVDYYDNTGESFPGGNPVNVSVLSLIHISEPTRPY